METSTKLGLGAGALGLALCCGGASCAGLVGLGTGTGLGILGESQMEDDEPQKPKEDASSAKPSVRPNLDTLVELRRRASETVRDCTETESADLTKSLTLASLVVTAGKNALPSPAPTLNTPQCSDAIPHQGGYMLGFTTLENSPAVTPAFFESRNSSCDRAATLYALGLAQQRGDFAVYDGPAMPSLPYEVKDAVAAFGTTCEKQENGELTSGGQVFDGTHEGAIYTGTVTYPNGAVVTGAFKKEDGTGEFLPTGAITVKWSDGQELKTSTDGDDSTEEPATYKSATGEPLALPGHPTAGDLNWAVDVEDPNDTRKTNYTFDPKTGELTVEDVWTDPAGVELRKIKDVAEMATFTGYGRFTDFLAESPYKGYEGYWESGKFSGGKGTLVLKNGQTIQTNFKDGAPVSTAHLKFKESEGAAWLELEFLVDDTGWLKWTNKAAGEWDKYTWDAAENKMVVRHMVKP